MRAAAAAVAAAVLAATTLGACGSDSGTIDELCTALRKREYTAVFNGFDPSDPVKALDQLRTARVALGDLKDAAPKAQRSDIQTEIDYVQALVDQLDALGDDADVSQVAVAMQQVTKAHPDVDEAAARLAAFQKKRC